MAQTPRSTRGFLWTPNGVGKIAEILERGAANPDGHPRIPAGTYNIGIRDFGESEFDKSLASIVTGYRGIPQVLDVPGRTSIEIHPANWVTELLGCLATGFSLNSQPGGDYYVPPGTSRTAFASVYGHIIGAVDSGGAAIEILERFAA